MKEAHEVFGDASRKSWQAPKGFTPAQLAEMELVAARGIEIEDYED